MRLQRATITTHTTLGYIIPSTSLEDPVVQRWAALVRHAHKLGDLPRSAGFGNKKSRARVATPSDARAHEICLESSGEVRSSTEHVCRCAPDRTSLVGRAEIFDDKSVDHFLGLRLGGLWEAWKWVSE